MDSSAMVQWMLAGLRMNDVHIFEGAAATQRI
jgi:hypothetical protein